MNGLCLVQFILQSFSLMQCSILMIPSLLQVPLKQGTGLQLNACALFLIDSKCKIMNKKSLVLYSEIHIININILVPLLHGTCIINNRFFC
jgi:hypothetical protein